MLYKLDMELGRLKQFRTIVDAGGLLKASEILGISGGGLSKSMTTLENELGYAVFEQKGRGLELTERGKKLYYKLPQVLKQLDEALYSTSDLTHAADVLRIVSFEVFTTHFLAGVISRKFREYSIEVREAVPGHMEPIIAEGQADIGITYLPIPHAKVEFLKVGRVKMAIFGLTKAWQKVRVEELPFVVPITPLHGTPNGVRGLDGWPEHLFERRIKYRVEMMETALQLCRSGVAVAFLPEFIARLVNQRASDDSKLSEIRLPSEIGSVQRDVFLIHRKGAEETKPLREIAKALRGIDKGAFT